MSQYEERKFNNADPKITSEYHKILKQIYHKLGTGETDSSQLDKVAFEMLGSKFNHAGYRDKIKLTKSKPYTISNTNISTDGTGGVQWLGCVYLSNKKIAVFDSFGRPGMFNNIKHEIDVDPDPINQGNIYGENCGQRSLAWLVIFDRYGYKKALQI